MARHRLRAALFPAKAADLNPMENVWSILSRRVFSGTKTYANTDSLLVAIQHAWEAFQADRGLRAKLVESMTDRLTQVVRNKGDCANS